MGLPSSFRGLLKSPSKRSTHPGSKQKSRRPYRRRLELEALEDRVVPSLDFRGVPTWTFQGPAPIVDPGDGFRQAGAIQHVAADRNNANNLFVATVNGGIWRTRNALASDPTQIKWTPLTDQYPSLSIGSVEFSPRQPDGSPVDTSDPTKATLYAGFGNFSSDHKGGPVGGLLRTTDGGDHWTVLGTTFSNASVTAIVPEDVRTPNGQLVLVATGNGVYLSDNGGQSFRLLSDVLPEGAASDLVGDLNNVDRFYVAIPGKGIYRSDNDGIDWKPVLVPKLVYLPVPGVPGAVQSYDTTGIQYSSNIRLAVHSVFDTSVVYAAVNGPKYVTDDKGKTSQKGTLLAYVYRSEDQGKTWADLGVPAPSVDWANDADLHMAIAADAISPNIVYVAGNGGPYLGDASQSKDRWHPITNDSTTVVWGPHADHRYMTFDHDGNLLDCDDGGIYRLSNPQVAAADIPKPTTFPVPVWTSLAGDLGITEFFSVSYSNFLGQPVIFGGAQDNGSSRQAGFGNPRWDLLVGGDGHITAVDDSSAAESYRYDFSDGWKSFERRHFVAGRVGPVEDVSTVMLADPSTPGDQLSGLNKADKKDDRPFELTPYVLNAVQPQRMLLGYYGLYESSDRGDTIKDITIPGQQHVYAMAYGGAGNADAAYAGIIYQDPSDPKAKPEARIYVRTAAGAPFQKTNYAGAEPWMIKLDPANWHTAYVVDDAGNVYQGTNVATAGESWRKITGNLSGFVRSVEVYKQGAQTVLLVGAQGGLYRTLNPEADQPTWTKFGLNLPNVPVYEVHYYPRSDLLLVGTLGRGAWTLANASSYLTSHPVMTFIGDASVRLEVDRDNPVLDDLWVNGSLARAVQRAALERIEIHGQGGSNTLTVDFTNGNPFPVGGLGYDGGGGDARLVLKGGLFNKEVHTALASATGGAGSIVFDGTSTINYAETFRIDDMTTVTDFANPSPGSPPFPGQFSFVRNTPVGGITSIDNGPILDNGQTLALSAPVRGEFATINLTHKKKVTVGDASGVAVTVKLNSRLAVPDLADLVVDAGAAKGNQVFVTATPAGATTEIFAKAAGDKVSVGDATHNLDDIHALTVTGGGGTSLALDDEANRDQFLRQRDPRTRLPIERQTRPVYQITEGAVVRTNNRADVTLDTTGKVVSSVPLDPLVATVNYSGLAGLTIQGGQSGNVFNVQSTAAGTPTTINAGNANDKVQVGDATHNLDAIHTDPLHPLTVHGGTGTTLFLDDEANRDQFLRQRDPRYPRFPIERQTRPVYQITEGAVVRTNNRADVIHDNTGKVVSSTPLSAFVATVNYTGLAGLTIQGGQSGNVFNVQRTHAGTSTTIKAGNGTAAVRDQVQVGDDANSLDGVHTLTVHGGTGTTLTLDDEATVNSSRAVVIKNVPYTLTTTNQVAFVIDDQKVSRTNRTLQVLKDARGNIVDHRTTLAGPGTVTYDGISQLIVQGGPTGNRFNVLATAAGTPTTIQAGNGTAAVRDQVQVGDATHNLDGVNTLTVHGGTGTTLTLDDEANRDRPLVFGILGPFSRRTAPTFLVTGQAVTRSNVVTETLLTTGEALPPLTLVATVNYTGLAGLTVQGGKSANIFNVQSTVAGTPVTVNGGSGGSTVNLSPTAHNLADLAGLVNVHGQGGTNALNAFDQATTFAVPRPGDPVPGDVLYQDHMTRLDVSPVTERTVFTYSGVQSISVSAGRRDNEVEVVYVLGTPAGVPVTVTDAGSGTSYVEFAVGFNSLDAIQGPVTIHGRAGTGDFLELLDQVNPNPQTYTLTPNAVSRGGMATITFDVADVRLATSEVALATVNVQGTAVGEFPTIGLDKAGDQAVLNVANMQGPGARIEGFGSDSITVDDSGHSGPRTATFASDPNFRYVLTGLAGRIYLDFDPGPSVQVLGGSGGNTFNVQSTLAGVNLAINAGAGNDTVNVGSAANTLDAIRSALTVNGRGNTTLNLNDQGSAVREEYDIFSGKITREPITTPATNPTQTVTYSGLASITVNGANSSSNLFFALGTPAGTSVSLNAGNGGSNEFIAIDEYNPADTSPGTDQLLGPVAFHGHNIYDLGERYDYYDGAAHTFTFSASGAVSTLQRDGAADLTYDGLGQMIVYVPKVGGNRLNVKSVAPGVFMNLTLSNGDVAVVGSQAPGLGGTTANVLGTIAFTDEVAGVTSTVTVDDSGDTSTAARRITIAPPPANPNNIGSSVIGLLGAADQGVYWRLNPGSSVALRGGAGNETFALTGALPNVKLSIDGGGGANTLDYSKYTGDVTVNLGLGTATGVDGGIANLQNFTGGSGNNTFIGPNSGGTFIITAQNAGTRSAGFSFTAFQNLTGGAADNAFVFSNGAGVTGNITGGAGANMLDYLPYQTPVAVNLALGTATGVGGRVANIQQIRGGQSNDTLNGNAAGTTQFVTSPGNDTVTGAGGTNTLFGVNQDSVWSVTATNAGTLTWGTNTTTFTGVQNLTGSVSVTPNTFVLSNGAGVTGLINGGGGVNTLDYSAWVGDIAVNLPLGTATGVAGGIRNIQNVTGSIGNDLLVGDGNANVLVGGTGRNVIIGGGGADRLVGGGGDNLLIGGTTAYDQDAAALDLIFREWLLASDFATRVAALQKGSDLLAGTGIHLDDTTAHPDGAADVTPGPGNNWVIA